MQYYSGKPVNSERGKEKREPVEMPKDFDFHMPVIDVMFKLSYWMASTTTAVNFEYITQLQSWVDTFSRKLEDLSLHQIFNSLNPVYLK